MKARNKNTGSLIVKMYERYVATSRIAAGTFRRYSDGVLGFACTDDGAEIEWDMGEHARDDDGQLLYVDEAGDLVPESDIETYDDES